MGCGETFGRIILSIFNLIFLLASALLLAFGITAKANASAIQTIFNYILPASTRSDLSNIGVDLSGIVVSNAVFMIIVGVVGIVIAGIGFFGACCLVKWLLAIYGIILIILLLAEVALIIFAAVYTQTFKSFIQQNMYNSLSESFRNDIQINSTGNVIVPSGAVDLSWATIQIREKCCGAYNSSDYGKFSWNKVKQYHGYNGDAAVPISCCNYSGSNFPPAEANFANIQFCLLGQQQYINQQNCYDALSNSFQQFINQYKAIAIGIAAGLAGLEIILIIITFVLCAHHSKDDKYV